MSVEKIHKRQQNMIELEHKQYIKKNTEHTWKWSRNRIRTKLGYI